MTLELAVLSFPQKLVCNEREAWKARAQLHRRIQLEFQSLTMPAWEKHHFSSQASSLTKVLMFGKRSVADACLAWKVPFGDEQGFLSP